MAVKAIRDTHGTLWRVPASPHITTKAGKRYDGCPVIELWWDREVKDKADENLIIRQANEQGRADLLQLTLPQAYDLIAALSAAVGTP